MTRVALPLTSLPIVQRAGRFIFADRGFETQYRGAFHAVHLHDYRGRMKLAGSEVALAPGDITLSPAWLASGYDLPASGWHWVVHFAISVGGDTVVIPGHVRGAGAARERFAAITTFQARGDALGLAQAAAALQALLLWLADRDRPAADPATRAAAVIDERFAEPLSVAAIAQAARVSPAHLARVFRQRFGVTVPHRLLQRRVEHARYLLESTDLPMWRIAERVGIADAQQFNKTVRRLLGASPSAIRATSGGAVVDPDR